MKSRIFLALTVGVVALVVIGGIIAMRQLRHSPPTSQPPPSTSQNQPLPVSNPQSAAALRVEWQSPQKFDTKSIFREPTTDELNEFSSAGANPFALEEGWQVGVVASAPYAGAKIIDIFMAGYSGEGGIFDMPGGIVRLLYDGKTIKILEKYTTYAVYEPPENYASAISQVLKKISLYPMAIESKTIADLDFPTSMVLNDGKLVIASGNYLFPKIPNISIQKMRQVPSIGDVFTNTKLLELKDFGYGISASPDFTSDAGLVANSLFFEAPDHTIMLLSVDIPFRYSPRDSTQQGKPDIMWAGGSTNTFAYLADRNSPCWGSHDEDIAVASGVSEADLIEIGKTQNGSILFGFKDSKHLILRAFYDEWVGLKKAPEDDYIGEFASAPHLSYQEYLTGHPMFLWQDPFGRWIKFLREDYVRPFGCG